MSEGRKKADHPCNKCCSEFSIALGNSAREGAEEVQRLIATALASGVSPIEVTARLAPIQSFYLQTSALIRDAFLYPGKISSQCCKGYAIGVSNYVFGVVSLTVSNALNPLIPIGTPSNQPPGTVYGNIQVALGEIGTAIAALKKINKRCEC